MEAGILRNIGISIAKGKYVGFLDADDYYPNKNSLKKLFYLAEKHQTEITGGSLYTFDNSTGKINFFINGQYFTNESFLNYRKYQFDGGFYRFIFKRDFLIKKNIYFPDLKRMQDPVFFMNAMLAAKKVFVIPDYVYAYRKNHKEIVWTNDLIFDKIAAISLILQKSRKEKLSHLHFLMAKNLLMFTYHHLHSMRDFKNQCILFWTAYRKIDFNLLSHDWPEDRINALRLKLFGAFLKSLIY